MLTIKRIENIINEILTKHSSFQTAGEISVTVKGIFRFEKYKNQYVDRNCFYFSKKRFIEIDADDYTAETLEASLSAYSDEDRYLHIIIGENYYWLHNLGTRWELEEKNKELPEFIRQDIEIIYEEKDGFVNKYYSIPFIQKIPEYISYGNDDEERYYNQNEIHYEETGEYIDAITYRFNSTSLDFKNDELFINSVLIFAREFCNYPLTKKELSEDFENIINNFKIQMY